jgi:hypothetical protein
MSNHHDESELTFLKEMSRLSPEEFNAWLNLNNLVGQEDCLIPKLYRELIGVKAITEPS